MDQLLVPGLFSIQQTEKDMWTGSTPMDTDILMTHMLSQFHLDIAGFGNENLLKEMWRTRPRLHVLGHVHRGYGKDYIVYDSCQA